MQCDIPHWTEIEVVEGHFKDWRGYASGVTQKYCMVTIWPYREGWVGVETCVLLVPLSETCRYLKILKGNDRKQEH